MPKNDSYAGRLLDEIKRLNTQIGKMKNCNNCIFFAVNKSGCWCKIDGKKIITQTSCEKFKNKHEVCGDEFNRRYKHGCEIILYCYNEYKDNTYYSDRLYSICVGSARNNVLINYKASYYKSLCRTDKKQAQIFNNILSDKLDNYYFNLISEKNKI